MDKSRANHRRGKRKRQKRKRRTQEWKAAKRTEVWRSAQETRLQGTRLQETEPQNKQLEINSETSGAEARDRRQRIAPELDNKAKKKRKRNSNHEAAHPAPRKCSTDTDTESDSEEHHEHELSRLMTLHTTRMSDPMALAGSQDENTLHFPDPDTPFPVAAAFEFILGLQHEQYELDTRCARMETETNTIRHIVFKLESQDYRNIEQLQKQLDLSGTFCWELFIAEYAFRDLLDEHKADVGFDLDAALRELKGDVGELVGVFEGEGGTLS